MAKQPDWLKAALDNVPKQHRSAFLKEASAVEREWHTSHRWGDDVHLEWWVNAFEDVDRRGDKQALLCLLRSDLPLRPLERAFLADLLERHQLDKKRGGQRAPLYDPTFADRLKEVGIANIKAFVKAGESVEQALDRASKVVGVPIGVLAAAYRGISSSRRRWKQRMLQMPTAGHGEHK